jgi:hypothetical protein
MGVEREWVGDSTLLKLCSLRMNYAVISSYFTTEWGY